MKKDREVSKSGIGLKNRSNNIHGGVIRGNLILIGLLFLFCWIKKDLGAFGDGCCSSRHE
jgi:hypothetical protein